MAYKVWEHYLFSFHAHSIVHDKVTQGQLQHLACTSCIYLGTRPKDSLHRVVLPPLLFNIYMEQLWNQVSQICWWHPPQFFIIRRSRCSGFHSKGKLGSYSRLDEDQREHLTLSLQADFVVYNFKHRTVLNTYNCAYNYTGIMCIYIP